MALSASARLAMGLHKGTLRNVALVIRIERGESSEDGPLCAKVFAGPLADLGELVEEAVGRAVQDGWGRFGTLGCRPSVRQMTMRRQD